MKFFLAGLVLTTILNVKCLAGQLRRFEPKLVCLPNLVLDRIFGHYPGYLDIILDTKHGYWQTRLSLNFSSLWSQGAKNGYCESTIYSLQSYILKNIIMICVSKWMIRKPLLIIFYILSDFISKFKHEYLMIQIYLLTNDSLFPPSS